MDDEPGWRLLEPGELVHVDADLNITSRVEFPDAPSHLLHRADLSPVAAAAQHPPSAG
jgi:glutamine amidotransferase